jgi:hypothetical protein
LGSGSETEPLPARLSSAPSSSWSISRKVTYKDIHKIDDQPDHEEIFKVLRKAA